MTVNFRQLIQSAKLQSLPLSSIRRAGNIRTETLVVDDLASSIASIGLLEPVIVMVIDDPEGGWEYELVDGHRRLAAVEALELDVIDARVIPKQLASLEKTVLALSANIHYQTMSVVDEAEAVARLHDGESMKVDEIAGLIGQSDAYVQTRLAIAGYSSVLKAALSANAITISHARQVARAPREHHAMILSKIEDTISVSKLSKIVDKYLKDIQKANLQRQVTPEETGADAPSFSEAHEAVVAAEAKLRADLRGILVAFSEAHCAEYTHDVERVDFGRLSTDNVRTLLNVLSAVPHDGAVREGGYTAAEDDGDLVFWSGPAGKAAQTMELLLSRLDTEELRVEALERVRKYVSERTPAGKKMLVQRRDIAQVAAELGVSLENS